MSRCALWRCAFLGATLTFVLGSVDARAAAVSWVPNTNGLWQTPANWSSNPNLPGAADDVTINRPAAITVTLSSGDQSVRSLTSQENLVVGDGTALTLTLGAGGGLINGALTISPGAQVAINSGSFQANGAVTADNASLYVDSTGQLNLPTLATYSASAFGSLFRAFSGGTLNVSGLTSYSVGGNGSTIESNGTGSQVNMSSVTSLSPGTFNRSNIYALEGGTVNLSGLTSITTGAVDAYARGTGSTINFTNLTTFSGNNNADLKRLRAEGGGQIVSPNLTTIGGGTHIELSGVTSVLDLADVTSFNELSLLADSGATLSLPAGITSYSASAFGSLFRAFSGGTLNVSGLTSYSVGGNGSTIESNGTGSLVNMSGVTSLSPGTFNRSNIYALEGGTVNLSGLTSITTGATDAYARGTGSKINFTNLTTFSGNNSADLKRLRAENGGVIISPNLTTISNGTHIELSGPTSVLDLADVTNFNELSLLADSGATLSLPAGITSYSASAFGSLFRAFAGGTLNVSGLTSYSVGGSGSTIESNGTGSLVNMSGVTSFSPGTFNRTNMYALEGGTVNLSGVTSITTGAVDAYARGTGSTINFTNLTTFSGNNSADLKRLRAEGGGVIISPNLTTISNGTHIELSGPTSVLDLADVTSFNELSLLAESSATLSLPAGITSYSASAFGSQFRAFAGGTLNVSNLTSYSIGGNGSMIQSNGTGSLVNMSGVTSFSPGTFNRTNIYAQEGGTVNLSGVTSITTGATDAYASGTGSTINFTNLSTFSGNNFADLRRLRADSGGVIRIKSAGTTTVMNASVEVVGTGSITGDTLQVSTGATLRGNGLIDANYSQLIGGTMQIDIGGLTPDTEFDQIVIDGNAALGGTLEVHLTNSFVPVLGQTFEILQITGTRTGTFDIGRLSFLTGGLQWDFIYNPHSVVLEVVNFYGDYNGNGVFDAADYVVWSKFRDATGINQPADGDRNLVVNDLDYDYWRSRFGQTSGSGASGSLGVPEPAAACLLMIAAAPLLLRRRFQ